MDKMLYVAMTGASETMQAQAVKANNLANVTTPGFRAQFEQQRAMPVYGTGFPSRVYAATESPGHDFSPSAAQQTGNPLDVALQGEGWLAVLGADGTEAYTRRGDLKINIDGLLVTGAGDIVLGGGGPIAMPPARSVTIVDDGSINITPLAGDPTVNVTIDQLKLVNPDVNGLYQREDGLFANTNGLIAEADVNVRVKAGMLESSNVNAVGELIDLISLARKHELDVKMMRKAEENDQTTARLLQLS